MFIGSGSGRDQDKEDEATDMNGRTRQRTAHFNGEPILLACVVGGWRGEVDTGKTLAAQRKRLDAAFNTIGSLSGSCVLVCVCVSVCVCVCVCLRNLRQPEKQTIVRCLWSR